MRTRNSNAPRIALALAGGGPLGAIYEIGALCALEESLQGLDFNRLDHYVGVSAGSFIAAGLANGMTPRELCAAFIETDGASGGIAGPPQDSSRPLGRWLARSDDLGANDMFDPAWLMVPAYGEFARRAVMLPGLAASALWHATLGRKSMLQALERLGPALPTGIFSNALVHRRLEEFFSRPGRSNDFRQLRSRLTLVATDLDSGEAAPFGAPGWDHVPVSLAVQASSALPGLFPPVEVDDRYFVDGALKKTLHASIALDDGVDLLLCLNPLVPFNATVPQTARVMQRGLPAEQRAIPRIVDGGLPSVLSQTFRSMIHSRLELGMKHYERAYPGTDIVLVEPDQRDPQLYLANTFSYGQRRQLAEHAYQQTRAMLRSRRTEMAAKLARHGITLRADRLEAPGRHLVAPLKPPTRIGRAVASLQEAMDDLAHIVGQTQAEAAA